jgi:hypothetical protein
MNATIEKVENEVKSVVDAVETEAKKLETTVKSDTSKAKVEVSTEENLFLRTTEAAFLRTQVKIRDTQRQLEQFAKEAEGYSKTYSEKVESLFTKYALKPAEYVWDNLENTFKAIKKAA